jgi:ABC-2 type transport system ATP-binding protein
VLDEPANGLDAEGIRWLRQLLVAHRAAGRAVLLSSHLLHEVALVADRITVLQRTVRFQGSIDELLGDARGNLEDRYFEVLDEGSAR